MLLRANPMADRACPRDPPGARLARGAGCRATACGLRADELRARGCLPVRLELQVRLRRWPAPAARGRAHQALQQPGLLAHGLPDTEPRDAVRRSHARAFQALVGVPRRGVCDNMKTAVDKAIVGKPRSCTRASKPCARTTCSSRSSATPASVASAIGRLHGASDWRRTTVILLGSKTTSSLVFSTLRYTKPSRPTTAGSGSAPSGSVRRTVPALASTTVTSCERALKTSMNRPGEVQICRLGA